MVIAKFGSKSFVVANNNIYTPNGLSFSEELDLEETEVSGKKPTVKVKGVKLQTMSFDTKLDCRFVDVQAEIAYWKKILQQKKSYNFQLGSYKIGIFYLTKCDVKDIRVDKRGAYFSATLTLSFTEDGSYVNSHSNTSSKSSSTSTSKSSSTTSNAKAATVKASTTSKAAKVRKGSTIKPKSGVRWYYTAEGAIKKTGKSGKAYQKNMTVTYTYSKSGKIVCVNPQGLGWLKIEDVTVVKY